MGRIANRDRNMGKGRFAIKGTQMKINLLEYLSAKTGCLYLSDLHNLENRPFIQHCILEMDVFQFEAEEWNEAVKYITGQQVSFQTCEEAAGYLLESKIKWIDS